MLRPPVAQERVEQRPFCLVHITLKKAFTDGTVAVALDVLACPTCQGWLKLLAMLKEPGPSGGSPPVEW